MKGEAKRKIERQLPGFTATHVAIAYSVGGESFEVVHSLPGETRDLRASFEEEGGRSGRACASVPVTLVWRSPAGRLARRVHLLPGGAHDVEVRYTYLEAPSDALGGRQAQEWDVSAVALPYRGPLRAKQAALGEGLRLLDLAPLLMLQGRRLGEGVYAEVFAVDCPGLPRLCVKKYKIKGTHHWQEARSLAQVDHIPHLPRLVGVCPYPPAVLMTCHGAMTLQKWIEDLYERRHFLRILYDLTGILDGIHAGGFIHGDIHGDNVVLDLAEDGRAQLTLIDVGCMRPIHGDFGPMRDVLGMGLLTMVARLLHGDSFAMLDECFRGFLDEGKASCAEIRRRILPFLN